MMREPRIQTPSLDNRTLRRVTNKQLTARARGASRVWCAVLAVRPAGARSGSTASSWASSSRRSDKSRLAGAVDVRARVSDPQSFLGWFRRVPVLVAPHHPYRLGLLLVQHPSERIVLRRTVYIALQQPPIATGQHYAPGTKQNHPAQPAVERTIPGAGVYGLRLFQKPYWDTTRLPNGRYLSSSGRGTQPATEPDLTSRSKSGTRPLNGAQK
jgi:hypothetical protein